MGDPYKSLAPGAVVTQISRTAYNDMLSMLRWWKTNGLPTGSSRQRGSVHSTTEILVRNDSGASVPAFGILGLDDPIILPTDDPYALRARPAFAGVEATVADHAGKWAALLEPASDSTADAANSFARAVLIGTAVVRVYVNSTDDLYCDVIAEETVSSETVWLGTGSSGARILWLDPAAEAEGIYYAVVCLGGGGGVPMHWGTLDAALDYDDTTGVAVTLDVGGTQEGVLPPPTMTEGTITSGSHVLIALIDGSWYVILAPC